MARFAAWAEERECDAGGLHYRRSPYLADKCTQKELAEFGTQIQGTPHGTDWVKLKGQALFLPIMLRDTKVLTRLASHDRADDDSAQVFRTEYDQFDKGLTLSSLGYLYDGYNSGAAADSPDKKQVPQEDIRREKIEIHKFDDRDAFETGDLQPGTGVEYKVVGYKTIIRSSPSVDGKMRNFKMRGDIVEVFDWDLTRKWRRCYDADIRVTGWMMIDHPEFGPLLRPLGFEEYLDPLTPVCAAVIENDWVVLSEFITEGMPVNAVGQGALSPLRLAAEKAYLECCVYLLQASAMIRPNSIAPGPARTLIEALSGQFAKFDLNEFENIVQLLAPEAQVVADRLFETASSLASPKPNSSQNELQTSSSREQELPSMDQLMDEVMDEENGNEYEVVCIAVRIRAEPNENGAVIGMRTRGQIVKMYEFDESKMWRRVETGGATAQSELAQELFEPEGTGWVLLRHAKMGDLMKPKSLLTGIAG